VDLLVVGHDHSYQLTKPIRHLSVPEQTHPYVELITAGGGAPLYSVHNDRPWSYRGESVHNWVMMDANAERLLGIVYLPDGTELDRFELRKDRPLTEPVAFEWIEQLRFLGGVQAHRDRQQVLRGYFEDVGEPMTVYVPLANLLPEPMTISVSLQDGPSWEVEPGQPTYALPPAEGEDAQPSMTWATMVIRPRSQDCFRPRPRLRLEAISAYGQEEVVAEVLAVTLRRNAQAARAQGPVTIDGRLDEATWEQAETLSPFVFAAAGNEFEAGETETTNVHVCYDDDCLLLGVQVNSPAPSPVVADQIEQSDHLRFFLASQTGQFSGSIDSSSRSRFSSDELEVAAVEGIDGWSAELRVPWSALTLDGPPVDGPGLYLNVARQEGDETLIWSPTFGTSMNQLTAGRLMIR
jgi:hypothetical protein